MRNKIIISCSLLLASSAALAQQSLLNAAQALQGAQSTSQATTAPAPSITDQLENAAEQKLLQAAPASIQQDVQNYQEMQQLQNAVGGGSSGTGSVLNPLGGAAIGSGSSLSNPLGGAGSLLSPSTTTPPTPGN